MQPETRDTLLFDFFLFRLLPCRFNKSNFFCNLFLGFYSRLINLLFSDFIGCNDILFQSETRDTHFFDFLLLRLLPCRFNKSNFFDHFFLKFYYRRIPTLHLNHAIPYRLFKPNHKFGLISKFSWLLNHLVEWYFFNPFFAYFLCSR